jgi:tetratricopeptide (TPR) repeat protein
MSRRTRRLGRRPDERPPRGSSDARRTAETRAVETRATRDPGPASTRGAHADEPTAARAATAVWAALAALAALRFVLAFTPAMALWGANTLRFAPPLWGWLPWALAALLLVPPIARRVTPLATRVGDALATHDLAAALLALALAALAWSFPDQLFLAGDFTLRLGAVRGQVAPDAVFPQATPLDLLLHYRWPVAVHRALGWDGLDVERAMGALKAAALALLAVAWGRALRLRGAAAFAAIACAACGGHLALLTGYGKALSDLLVIVALVAWGSLRVAREGKGAFALGAALAIGILLHRSAALWLLPAGLALAAAMWTGRRDAPALWRMALAVAPPVLALALAAPRVAHNFALVDREHLLPMGGGVAAFLRATFELRHLTDMASEILLLAPLAFVAPFALAPIVGRARRAPEAPALAALAAVSLLTLLLVHPRQGPFQDWDVFAPSALALTLVASWAMGETVRASRRHAWLAPAIAAAALAPSLAWLSITHDSTRGVTRLRAYLEAPPERPANEAAALWAWLGVREQANGNVAAAADALHHAASLAPSPRNLFEWGMAEADAGRPRDARAVLRRAVGRSPHHLDAWIALATVTADLGDRAGARDDLAHALALDPRNPTALALLADLARADSLAR